MMLVILHLFKTVFVLFSRNLNQFSVKRLVLISSLDIGTYMFSNGKEHNVYDLRAAHRVAASLRTVG